MAWVAGDQVEPDGTSVYRREFAFDPTLTVELSESLEAGAILAVVSTSGLRLDATAVDEPVRLASASLSPALDGLVSEVELQPGLRVDPGECREFVPVWSWQVLARTGELTVEVALVAVDLLPLDC